MRWLQPGPRQMRSCSRWAAASLELTTAHHQRTWLPVVCELGCHRPASPGLPSLWVVDFLRDPTLKLADTTSAVGMAVCPPKRVCLESDCLPMASVTPH